SPVTAALQSLTVIGLCINFSQIYSDKTAAAVVTTTRIHAFSWRKFQIPNRVAGRSPMMTMSMILLLLTLSRICGDDDTCNFSFNSLSPLLLFPLVCERSLAHGADCLFQWSLCRTHIAARTAFYTLKP